MDRRYVVYAVTGNPNLNKLGLSDLMVRACVNIKKKDQSFDWSFMERVTRLELATSTLARWRSTG